MLPFRCFHSIQYLLRSTTTVAVLSTSYPDFNNCIIMTQHKGCKQLSSASPAEMHCVASSDVMWHPAATVAASAASAKLAVGHNSFYYKGSYKLSQPFGIS